MSVLDDVLQQADLDEAEAKAYSALLANGTLTILELSNKADLKRPNLYNVLKSLEEKELVNKISDKKTVKYFPNPPREIRRLLELKENQINLAKNTFEILASGLQSQYNLISQKPVITYLEGLTGLQKLYQDILDTGKDIFLLRSTYDDKRSDVNRLIQKQIVEQVKRGIHAKVIGPPESDARELFTKYDKIHQVEERFVDKFTFNLPSQIIIYGNKTAVATIRKDIIITLIDNADITQTFRILFNFVWEYVEPEHNEFVKNW